MCVASILLWAIVTAKFANKAPAKLMNRMLGFGLAILSVFMIAVHYI